MNDVMQAAILKSQKIAGLMIAKEDVRSQMEKLAEAGKGDSKAFKSLIVKLNYLNDRHADIEAN